VVGRHCIIHKRAGRDDGCFAFELAQRRCDILSSKNIADNNVINGSVCVGVETDFRDKKYTAVITERDRAEAIPYRDWLGDVVGSSDNIRNVALLSESRSLLVTGQSSPACDGISL
jgi:hypothetical protein